MTAVQRALVVSLAAVATIVAALLLGQLVVVSLVSNSLGALAGVVLVAAAVTGLATWAHRARRRQSGRGSAP